MSAPRFSIIPAEAVLACDPRDLQVLCLLGRHTNNQGWCRRSQVEMATELGVARSTVQRALRRLIDEGWLEQHDRKRADGGDAACSYRVLLDRSGVFEDGEGAAPAGTPCPPRAGTPCPSMGGHLMNGKSNDLEREGANAEIEKSETPIDDGLASDGRGIDAFLRIWPSAAVDCADKTQRAWAALTPAERAVAIDGVGDYERECRRMGRKTRHAGSTYLAQKMWVQVKKLGDASGSDAAVTLNVWSKEWWAAGLAWIERGEVRKAAVRFKLGFDGTVKTAVYSAAECASNDQIALMKSYPLDGEVVGRWAHWFERHGIRLPSLNGAVWVFLPAENPPRAGQSVWGG